MMLRALRSFVLLCISVGLVSVGRAAPPAASSREALDAIHANAVGLQLVEFFFDSRGHSRLATLQKDDVNAVEAKLNAVASFITRRYAVHRASIQRVASEQLPQQPPHIKVIVNEDVGTAILVSQSSCTPSSTGAELRVVLSLQAVDALLRGGLAAAYASKSLLKPLRSGRETETPPDNELARRYLILGAALKTSEKKLSDLELALLMQGFQQVEGHLEGALLFVIGHEIGHQVMRHHCLPCPTNEAMFQQRETDADFFAATLTTSSMLEFIPSPELQDDLDGSSSFIGAATFLQQGYERLLLSRTMRDAECTAYDYPDNDERTSVVAEAVRDVFVLRNQDRQVASEQSLERRIELITRKYQDMAKSAKPGVEPIAPSVQQQKAVPEVDVKTR